MFKSRRLFPYLLFSFIVVSAVFSLSLSYLSQKRVILKQKAVEEQNQLLNQSEAVSQWVPIDLASFNQEIDKETAELTKELNNLPSLKLSAKEKTKRIDVLNRSLEIKQITKEEHNLMDGNKDGKISYEEFNKRDVILAEKVYQLRHTTLSTLDDGLYDEQMVRITTDNLNQHGSLNNNVFRVIVEAGIYQEILVPLLQYRIDVQRDWGYDVRFYLCNNCQKETNTPGPVGIKNLLRVQGTIGTVFVGDLPVAWWLDSDPDPVIVPYQFFPIDLYYMDLNGNWREQSNCLDTNQSCFVEIAGDGGPEIFLGRLTVPSEAEEISLLNNYFRKNHLYRTSPSNFLPQKSLGYDAINPLDVFQRDFVNKVNYVYQVYETVAQPNSTSEGLKIRWQNFRQHYEHTYVLAHGSPRGHWFSSDNKRIYSSDVRAIKPPSFFFTLDSCSAARYTEPDYLAGWYVFQEGDFGLVALGYTHPGILEFVENYFLPLREKNHIGLAFKEWHLKYSSSRDMGFYGDKTLIGDPTLKVFTAGDTAPCINNNELITPVREDGPQTSSLINYGDPLLQIRDDSSENSCFPHYVVYSVWPPEEGARSYYRSSKFLENDPITLQNRTAVPWTVSPPLPPGNYQWRANLKNSSNQTLRPEDILKINFSVCSQPSVPQLEMLVYGDKRYQGEPVVLHPGENLTLRIKDVSDRSTSCFPHDVIFNIWPRGATMYVKSSNWITGDRAIHDPQGTKEWTFRANDLANLPYGEYELRANLDNKSVDKQGNQRTMDSRAPQPLIIPFTYSPMITPTPTPTTEPEPTPTPWHSVCSKTADRVHVYCKQVAGEGENKCSTDLDCETDCGEIYGACKSNTCSPGRECRRGEDNYCACYQE